MYMYAYVPVCYLGGVCAGGILYVSVRVVLRDVRNSVNIFIEFDLNHVKTTLFQVWITDSIDTKNYNGKSAADLARRIGCTWIVEKIDRVKQTPHAPSPQLASVAVCWHLLVVSQERCTWDSCKHIHCAYDA